MGITHSPWAWIVIAVVLVLLFGGKKLPEAARGVGRSLRIFKSEMEEMKTEGDKNATPPAPQAQAQVTDKPIDVQTVQPTDVDHKTA